MAQGDLIDPAHAYAVAQGLLSFAAGALGDRCPDRRNVQVGPMVLEGEMLTVQIDGMDTASASGGNPILDFTTPRVPHLMMTLCCVRRVSGPGDEAWENTGEGPTDDEMNTDSLALLTDAWSIWVPLQQALESGTLYGDPRIVAAITDTFTPFGAQGLYNGWQIPVRVEMVNA